MPSDTSMDVTVDLVAAPAEDEGAVHAERARCRGLVAEAMRMTVSGQVADAMREVLEAIG